MAKRRRNAPRDYPRTARLNELLREIIASQIDRIDDDRMGWVSVSGVDVDNELTLARVYLSSLEDDLDASVEVLEEHRGSIKKAIGSQARLRRVPELQFITDPAIQSGGRVEEILSELRDAGELE
ncbi:MAG: 30S ribosome-binding factor RbfA [Actinomycetota bacterium]